MSNAFAMATLPPKSQRTYSTEEQWTGEYWIDGKKIYRKTIVQNIESSPLQINTNNLDAEIIWLDEQSSFVRMVLPNKTATVFLPVNGWARDSYTTYMEILKRSAGNTINCFVGSELLTNQLTAYCTLRYTKTTE